jgi:hypothetical protein
MQIRGDTGGVWGCYFSFEGVRTERGVFVGVTVDLLSYSRGKILLTMV